MRARTDGRTANLKLSIYVTLQLFMSYSELEKDWQLLHFCPYILGFPGFTQANKGVFFVVFFWSLYTKVCEIWVVKEINMSFSDLWTCLVLSLLFLPCVKSWNMYVFFNYPASFQLFCWLVMVCCNRFKCFYRRSRMGQTKMRYLDFYSNQSEIN